MKSVMIGEVAVINAAAERISGIFLAVGPPPLPGSWKSSRAGNTLPLPKGTRTSRAQT